MAIEYEDEFDYLENEEINSEEGFAPQIKGSSTPQTTSKELAKEVVVKTSQKEEESKETEQKPQKEFESQIYIVKVTTNKENKALEMIADKVGKKEVGIYAIARPHGLRGYILLESPDKKHAEDAIFNLPYVKGIIGETVKYEEIRRMLEPVASEIKIEKGDIVEIISEPFKNEKAKVIRVDKPKNECVVSLLGAAVPIPVTVKLDNVRIIRRDELEE
jgi:transcription termination/antitermination protein NusG